MDPLLAGQVTLEVVGSRESEGLVAVAVVVVAFPRIVVVRLLDGLGAPEVPVPGKTVTVALIDPVGVIEAPLPVPVGVTVVPLTVEQ